MNELPPQEPGLRQIIFNVMMHEDPISTTDGWWGTSDNVAEVDKVISVILDQLRNNGWLDKAQLEDQRRKDFEAGWIARGNACYPGNAHYPNATGEEFEEAYRAYRQAEQSAEKET